MKYVIGFTGNIATGKTTACTILERLGAKVLDADKVAHQVMERGTPVYTEIVNAFGSGIVDVDGRINRRALGAIVFADSSKLRLLEALSHPAVLERVQAWLEAPGEGVYVVEAVKLLEAGLRRHCDAVWVICCTQTQQLARVMARGLSEAEGLVRIQAQPPLHHKLCAAHVLVDNSQGLGELEAQLVYAWRCLPLNNS